ncbi:Non-catalytic module family DOC2 [Piromyces sp. E2]|nr:Non-catalytic module family DOC2 [Piromyces sp. E2]|eukprot:OUM56634.1 Non-catalytic module family DOC2 [Piromyces sp. E2]
MPPPSDNATTATIEPTTETQVPSVPSASCWAEKLGYSCCEQACRVIVEDEDGAWGSENGQWCGIISESCQQKISKCWSIAYGYPCCQTSSYVFEQDEQGSWGYEDNHWCGIIPSN